MRPLGVRHTHERLLQRARALLKMRVIVVTSSGDVPAQVPAFPQTAPAVSPAYERLAYTHVPNLPIQKAVHMSPSALR